jgi:hypothetical protein
MKSSKYFIFNTFCCGLSRVVKSKRARSIDQALRWITIRDGEILTPPHHLWIAI